MSQDLSLVLHDDEVPSAEHSLLGIHHQHQQHQQQHPHQQQQQHSGSSVDRGGGGGLTPKTPGSPNTVRSADTPFESGAPGTPLEGGIAATLTADYRTPSEDDRGTPRSRGIQKFVTA